MFNLFSKKRNSAQPRARVVKARFDAAQTTRDNMKHWAAADYLSADAAANASVRQTLRIRARYEVENNSYARGIVLTLANDTIGTGPRLQMITENAAINKQVEAAFAAWSSKVGLADKLRTARVARCQDGEAFILLAQNPALVGDINLDLQLIEADRVASATLDVTKNVVDGITYDKHGNPKSYRVLKTHPGDMHGDSAASDIAAEHIIHSYRQDRPGQSRGVPELTAALPLFAQLRRFTLAVITAAETAANYSGVIQTDAPAGGEADELEPLDPVELERNMLLTLPAGWKMGQFDPKQPVATYAEFKREILNEIARCLNMPFNVAAGNSSGYNYASGRLDHQVYIKAIKVERAHIERVILERIFTPWMREYTLVSGIKVPAPAHMWIWDGNEHVDPAKEATAQATRLGSLTTSLAAEYAKAGKDWEKELRQIARERALCAELGLNPMAVTPAAQLEKDEE